MYEYMYVYIYAWMFIRGCFYMDVHTWMCVCTSNACVYECMYMCICWYVRTYIHLNIHALFIHTCIYMEPGCLFNVRLRPLKHSIS